MQESRRTFLQTLASAPLASAAADPPPNIVWIMADDLGFAELGCYGQEHIKTPNIDRLASQGTLYNTAYAGSCVCAPSRSVLMTGLHGGHTPIRSNPGGCPILPGETTVAELLNAAGYSTGLFGKWGLGDIGSVGVPWQHGFDEFYGFLHQAHAHFQYPRFLYDNDKESPLPGNENGARKTYANDAMADRAFDFIRRRKEKPFFLYYSPTIPHFEPHVPEDSLAEYRGKFPDVAWGKPGARLAMQPELRAAYAGMVSRADRYVGRIVALLDELKLASNTIVFFTSDNGGTLPEIPENFFKSNGVCRGAKGSLYEGGIRTPMIARWPGRVPAGRRSNYAWYFADFLATACDLARVKNTPKSDGISVVPDLFGKPQKPHPDFYWEHLRYDGRTARFAPGLPMQAIRRDNWKAVRPKIDGPVELYDLAADPSETRNLAEAKPDLAKEFDQRLRTSRTPPRSQTELPHPWWEARS